MMEPQPKRRYTIPAEATIEVIGGKWKTLILCHLSYGPKRTNELKKAMPDITQKMLTQQLRELEEDGVIFRTVYNQVPPKVVYEMTEIGESLKSILDQMCEWGEKFIQGQFHDFTKTTDPTMI
jgi:DNA-binding HxlR family transcriptional regulator